MWSSAHELARDAVELLLAEETDLPAPNLAASDPTDGLAKPLPPPQPRHRRYYLVDLWLFRRAFLEHLKISVALLLIMAILSVIIGGIGLVATMSMNVIDRTREIGVMRSVGATDRAISSIFVGESIVIGLVSWALAAVLSVPLTFFVSDTFGEIFIETALEIVVSPGGILAWAALASVISFVAAQYPAWRACRRQVRDTLAYE